MNVSVCVGVCVCGCVVFLSCVYELLIMSVGERENVCVCVCVVVCALFI